MTDVNDLKRDPTENRFHLTATIIPVKIGYRDEQSTDTKNVERDVITLVPVNCDETIRFLQAWLGPVGKQVECILQMRHPFNIYARAAVMYPKSIDPSSTIDEYHLFLMSYGLEQIILKQKREFLHREIQFTVMPASTEHPDGSPVDGKGEGDDLLPFQKKQY